MVMRDVPGWAGYFWANQYFKDIFGVTEAEKSGTHWTGINLCKRILAGGIAGCFGWGAGYPFDVIKTEIQCTQD